MRSRLASFPRRRDPGPPRNPLVVRRVATVPLRPGALGPRLHGDDVRGKGCALDWRHSRGGGTLVHLATHSWCVALRPCPCGRVPWVPAFTGMTFVERDALSTGVIPAEAGP